MQKAAGYDLFYRENQSLPANELATFILSARRPRANFFTQFVYQQREAPGVYYSALPVIRRVGIISLNELSDETYNAFAKCFASQRKVKEQAFQALEHVGYELVSATVMTFLAGLRQYWFAGEEKLMSAELTPEKVMAMGESWIHFVLQNLPPEERLAGLRLEDRLMGLRPEEVLRQYRPEERLSGLQPEERLRGLRPEERLRGLRPEERLAGLSPEEIEGYLQQLKQKAKEKNGEQQHKN
ncbi:MAG: hypothetical protein KJ063_02955 [Anaerolineae bacterium]|nr:hypothetical protein [Anaerolineae bacterium]